MQSGSPLYIYGLCTLHEVKNLNFVFIYLPMDFEVLRRSILFD